MRIFKYVLISLLLHVIIIYLLIYIDPFEAQTPVYRSESLVADIFRVEPPKSVPPPEPRTQVISGEPEEDVMKTGEVVSKPEIPDIDLRIRRSTSSVPRSSRVGRRSTSVGERDVESVRPVAPVDQIRGEVGERAGTINRVDLPNVDLPNNVTPQSTLAETNVGEIAPQGINPDDIDIRLDTPRAGGKIVKSMGIYGTNYGSGNLSSGGNTFGGYQMLMRRLGSDITSRIPRGKLDLVFIVDNSASMADNIRGVKAYVGDLLDILNRDGYDLGLGLVIYSDTRTDGLQARGITEDQGDFRNWMFRIETSGGGDQAESTYEALIAAIEMIDYRWFASKAFVLVTDAPVHDADINGQSRYALDEIIEKARSEKIMIDVLGIDYLPLKQIASGTGGTWFLVPGGGETDKLPYPMRDKTFAWLQGLCTVEDGRLQENITVFVGDSQADRLTIALKVLDPNGIRIFSTEKTEAVAANDGYVEISPMVNLRKIVRSQGTYTLIWRVRDNANRTTVLRRYVNIN